MNLSGASNPPRQIIHATTVAVDGRGVVIRGASGSGKSALGLQLMAYGARLVADDRTILDAAAGHPVASCPAQIRGMIEARGVGLLRADPAPPTPVVLVVDLDRKPDARLPSAEPITMLGCTVDLISGRDMPNLAAIVLQMLKGGRIGT